jgi:predicted enzyme related to lactoylglutathione lyase
MPEFNGYPAGTPSWVDIGTTDIEGAKAFYSRLFGWDIADAGPDSGGYHMCLLRGKPVAGLGPAQNPGPPYWATYVTVDDADTTAKAVESVGGSVLLAPMDVLDAGRMAVFADTTGVPFSAWQPGQHLGAAIANEAGGFSWSELNTRDVAAATRFYESVFGWKAETSTEPMAYTQLANDGKVVAGMIDITERVPAEVPAHWLVYFGTDDCEQSVATAEEAGGTVRVGPMDIPGVGKFAVLQDPQGAVFAVFQM